MKIKLDYIYANGFSFCCETDALDNLMKKVNEELSCCNPISIVGIQIYKEENSIYKFDFSAIVTYMIYDK